MREDALLEGEKARRLPYARRRAALCNWVIVDHTLIDISSKGEGDLKSRTIRGIN
jgi:hypothetical protein